MGLGEGLSDGRRREDLIWDRILGGEEYKGVTFYSGLVWRGLSYKGILSRGFDFGRSWSSWLVSSGTPESLRLCGPGRIPFVLVLETDQGWKFLPWERSTKAQQEQTLQGFLWR